MKPAHQHMTDKGNGRKIGYRVFGKSAELMRAFAGAAQEALPGGGRGARGGRQLARALVHGQREVELAAQHVAVGDRQRQRPGRARRRQDRARRGVRGGCGGCARPGQLQDDLAGALVSHHR